MKLPRSLTTFITCGTCIVALACGHEAATPSAVTAPAIAAAPAIATALTTVDVPAPTGCIEVDAELGGERITLAGRIFVDDAHEHPARGKTHPFILLLDVPRCALGIDEKQVTEIQLAASESVALKPLVGRRVTVSGDPFVAHTAWHARAIVLMTNAAIPL